MSSFAVRRRKLLAIAPLAALALLAMSLPVNAGVPAVASIFVTKVTDPAQDGQDFTYLLNGVQTFTLDTDPTSVLTPLSFSAPITQTGTLIITESDESGWTLTDIQCTGDAEVSYNVAADNVSLDVDGGESIACTFYNTKFAQLTIQKVTVPAVDPQDFNFDMTGTGVPADLTLDTDPTSMFVGSNITYPMQPDDLGEYSIVESAVAGWTLTDLECTGNSDSDALRSLVDRVVDIGVDAGELITCTFTNTKDGFGTDAPPTDTPTDAPTDAPTEAPTDGPTSDPTVLPTDGSTGGSTGGTTFQPTDDQGGETDTPTEPGTDTAAGPITDEPTAGGVVLGVVAFLVLAAVLVVTTPKRRTR